MKKLFVIIGFIILVNVFIIMFNSVNLFPVELDASQNYTGMDDSGDTYTGDQAFEDISGYDFSSVLGIIFVDVNSDPLNILASIAMLGGAAFLAWLTRSPAPFVLAVISNVFKNAYVNSMGFLEQFPINNYMMLGGMIAMILLLIVTCLEYLTHGDA